eukprot:UN07333
MLTYINTSLKAVKFHTKGNHYLKSIEQCIGKIEEGTYPISQSVVDELKNLIITSINGTIRCTLYFVIMIT